MLAFGLDEALLLASALFLHVCVFAALMRPFAVQREQSTRPPPLRPAERCPSGARGTTACAQKIAIAINGVIADATSARDGCTIAQEKETRILELKRDSTQPPGVAQEGNADAGADVDAHARPEDETDDIHVERILPEQQVTFAPAGEAGAQAKAEDATPVKEKDKNWIRTSLRLYRLLLSNPPFLAFSFSLNLCIGSHMM